MSPAKIGKRQVDNEIAATLVFLILAAVGWWALDSLPLAIAGALGCLTCLTLYIWQRHCLTGVSYQRRLGQTRAEFGEQVSLDLEILNDKVLPVTWLHIEDEVPATLPIRGGTITSWSPVTSRLTNVLPVLPYQRVRRHLTISCRERGLHTFGGATLRSGDPVGLRTRSSRATPTQELLVFPKCFALPLTHVASRLVIGDLRAKLALLEDPSRIAGVREYRPGDPLRSIDWRATARGTALLVRQFEPSVSLRTALFLDYRVPGALFALPPENSQQEFAIAVGASLLTALAERGVAIGLFASGTIDGAPLALAPTGAPSQLPLLLEALARSTATQPPPFASTLATESRQLRPGTSVLVVASDYPDQTLEALADLRRRHAVTAVWISGGTGTPPPRGQVDALVRAEFTDDWRDKDVLELAV
jgi:uncharacterized protein (DUF58 family)